MKIRLEKISQVGNNCLADLYFDDVKINTGGHLMMSPGEFEQFEKGLLGGAALASFDEVVVRET